MGHSSAKVVSMEEPGRPLPFIDAHIEHVGIRKLRYLNKQALRDLRSVIVLQGTGDQPLAVIVPYGQYMAAQKIILDSWNAMLRELPGIGWEA